MRINDLQVGAPTALPVADAQVIELLARVADEIAGLRQDLRFLVADSAPASNGRVAVKSNRNSKVDPQDCLLRLLDVAALLGISARTLRRMRADGKGPRSVDVGGRPRWKRTVVERWIAERPQ